MKVYYDGKVDAVYLKLSDCKPDGVVEIAEGINLDTTSDGKLAGIEILKASQKINVRTILSYTLDVDRSILKQNVSQRQVRENKTTEKSKRKHKINLS
jgi:uncharacterized protein YuzE